MNSYCCSSTCVILHPCAWKLAWEQQSSWQSPCDVYLRKGKSLHDGAVPVPLDAELSTGCQWEAATGFSFTELHRLVLIPSGSAWGRCFLLGSPNQGSKRRTSEQGLLQLLMPPCLKLSSSRGSYPAALKGCNDNGSIILSPESTSWLRNKLDTFPRPFCQKQCDKNKTRTGWTGGK